MAGQGLIERFDRAHNGELAQYISEANNNGWSHREIVEGLAETFGYKIDRTTVLRWLQRNPSTPAGGKPVIET